MNVQFKEIEFVAPSKETRYGQKHWPFFSNCYSYILFIFDGLLLTTTVKFFYLRKLLY